MAAISNKEAALIGLLLEEPMYPYQIEKVVQFRDMRYWTDISMSSIYKVLSKLEDRGMVESRLSITDDNRPQKVFSITEKGKDAMREKVRELLSKPEHIKWGLDLGTYNMDVLTERETGEALQKYEKELVGLLKGYEDLEEYMRGDGCPEWRVAVAVRPQYLLRSEMEWLKDLREKLGK